MGLRKCVCIHVHMPRCDVYLLYIILCIMHFMYMYIHSTHVFMYIFLCNTCALCTYIMQENIIIPRHVHLYMYTYYTCTCIICVHVDILHVLDVQCIEYIGT